MSKADDATSSAAAAGQQLLDATGISAILNRLADEIAARAGKNKGQVPAFVGIHTRGVTVAQRVRAILAERGLEVPLGTVDISLYRDDLDHRTTNPEIQASEIPFDVDAAHIIIFDDVLYTGRTIRSAMEGLMGYGRPAKIELAVLVDRGNRELPIQPDYVGERLSLIHI